MKKKLLLFLMSFCFIGLFAQDGELTNLQFDSTVVQGQTGLTFTFDYTANEAGTVEWQLITANPDGTPAWGEPNFAYTVVNIDAAADPTTLSFNYDVPSVAPLGNYTWAGKITLSGTDLGYNNTGNLVEVTDGGGTGGDPMGALTNLVFNDNVGQGQTGLTFSFDYTANQAGTFEWQLITALPDGSPDWGQPSFAYTVMNIDEAGDPTTISFDYDVPEDAAVGTYTWAGKITLGGLDLGYNNTGNLVEVTMVNDVDEAFLEANSFAVYPNPVHDDLQIVSIDSKAIFEIYNQLGQSILRNTEIGEKRTVDFSNFSNGMYFLKSSTGKTMRIVKN